MIKKIIKRIKYNQALQVVNYQHKNKNRNKY
jgi:hypothetical protein